MDFEQVERALDDLPGLRPGGPGLAVGVYADGKALPTAARGMATVEFGVPNDSSTRFDIASISKQFTATCLLLLERDGRLSLSDDIREHVPELRLGVPVTIDQCLRHTGGLPEWYGLQALTGVPFHLMDEERLVKVLAGARRTAFEPGTRFSYSNTGYVLAAVVVRRVTGRSLAEFARERLFGPLGMDDTVFRDDASVPLPRMAYGYDGAGARADTQESAVGDGGLVTSVADLAPWFGFLADGRVLGADVRAALLDPTVLADGAVLRYARGICHLAAGDLGDLSGYGHAGGMHGYVGNLIHLPEPGLGVAVLTNHSGLDPVGLSFRLARALAGQKPAHRPAPAGRAGGEAARTALLGHWHDAETDATLTLEPAAEGGLAMTGLFDTVLALGDDGRWRGQAGPAEVWLAPEDGRLLLGHTGSIRWPHAYERCDPPGEGPVPRGAWLNDETGVLAVLDEGVLRVGLTFQTTVTPGPAGTWRAGPFTLRLGADGDLLLSGFGLLGLRFAAQPEGTTPVGIPPGLV
ncbi:serine hydrolase domain-containing protein [Nonomuraea roseoviolacea]|uniref:CubicO group peptidase (Beta-lactamase class C family) n=1 Tax=Nonomuraea roseoviolacea subsp. carminata TaxID=160689 RepID=A0ABT1KC45_9ACTN|nr:serine hydrolase domain-containing protein [Nonomuraea roseoviolacea]MCP2351586.1 CubicO group peptidase (beta-lactamase class C family) [Nonomuraea roseoviolacea subsp. carminata]